MLQGWVIVIASLAYLGMLFAVAWFGDKRADAGRSLISNPYIYALSMAVYCTTWTFYGSVGRAAGSGVGFLPIYLGPTLGAAMWWLVLVKMVRISKANRITSIADFIASRYGKSQLLGGLVTVIAVIGVVPYIALQLKAVSNSFGILLNYPEIVMPALGAELPVFQDTTLYITLILAAFAILFGTRHLDASERHEGMVAAVAVESVVKLLAFVGVGLYVTYGIFDGVGDIFDRAQAVPALQSILTVKAQSGAYQSWASLMLLSMFSVMLLPRQFHMAVVENVNEAHVNKAIWLFPLYLFIINLFVLPIAIGGLLHFPQGNVDADTFVLALPMSHRQEALTLMVFIGGLSAATAMLIVETVALSIMVCNDLVMPLALRLPWLGLASRPDLSGVLLTIRRTAIVVVLLLGYIYFRVAGEAYALVAIGLISFAAVAQFAPVLLGGMFWKHATRVGAFAGLSAGFLVWAYTLLLPSFARSGWLPVDFIELGLFGIAWLKPLQLFGLAGMDDISHCLFWSLLANVGFYVGVSIFTARDTVEVRQASLFVDVFQHTGMAPGTRLWRGSASVQDLHGLLARFLGPARARESLQRFARRRGISNIEQLEADAELVSHAETLLAGAIGSASAHVMVSSVVQEEPLGIDEVLNILDEASQVRAYSRKLEQKQRELEEATAELREANDRLRELDKMKDDFVSTVSHELRTPLTSIRAFAEILHDDPDMDLDQRGEFLSIIRKESERLTRLINQVLDMAKLESGKAEWQTEALDIREVVEQAIASTSQLFRDRQVALEFSAPASVPVIVADRDRLMQVMINLLSNAVKFVDAGTGKVGLRLMADDEGLQVDVQDNGPGISASDQELIFEKFRQVGDTNTGKPPGTGLGLPISRQIIGHFGGRLWVTSSPGAGATFSFRLPCGDQAAG